MRIVILILGVLLSFGAFGQGMVIELKPEVRDDDNGKSLGGAVIEIYKGGTLFAKETSSNNGKVKPIELPVCIGCKYTIKIKKSGYVTKTAIVDAHSDYPEEMPPGTYVQKFEVSIFEQVEGIDFSFLDREPMVEFSVDPYGMVTYDQDKIKIMKKKIADLKKKMEEQKEKLEREKAEKEKMEADFSAYVAAGDAAMKEPDYEKAIGQYELALGIKPDDQPTKDKLEDAKIKLEEQRAKELADKEFGEKMSAAKEAYKNEELEKALELYKEASGIKPKEQLPKDLIAEIEAKIAERQKNEEAFNALVAQGDAAVSSEDYDQAISKYEEALDLRKDDGVQTKLDDAKKKKAALEDELKEQEAKRKEYEDLMASADAAFDTEDYDKAKSNYEAALKVIPDEQRPKDRITEIEKILKDRAAEQAAKEKLEADYQALMDEGKEKINQRQWPEAKSKYEEALKLKPNDPDALAQIDVINKEMEKAAAEEKLNAEYTAALNAANELFDQKKYAEAKSKYNEALGIKDEQEPKDKIAEIDRIVADAEKAAENEAKYKEFISQGDAAKDRKEYTAALDQYRKALDIKPGDSDAQAKIDAVNELIEKEQEAAAAQEKFDAFVASAEQAFNASDLDNAKLNYNKALEIKDDAAIRERVKEIEELIAKNQNEAETQAKYDAAIKEADAFYDANDYEKAVESYEKALNIKEDKYPLERIAELKEKIADQKEAAEKEEQFNTLVAEGDAAYAAEDYSKALSSYKEAIKVKPDPAISQKIGELNVKLSELEQDAAKRADYDEKIGEADAAFEDENWEGARSLYQEAGRIMPTESYPDERIEEIEKRMADEAAAEVEKNYQKIIDKADQLMKEDRLDDAKTYYERALGIKPADPYPTEKIAEIDQIKKDRASALSEEKRKEEEFNALIADGDRAFNASNWTASLAKYEEALKVKPDAPYPKSRIDEVKAKMDANATEKAKKERYDQLIAEGDDSFDSQSYQEAIKKYREALDVMPDEQYPKDRILSAEDFMKRETENEEEEAYQKILTVAQEKFDGKDYEKAIELYLRAKTMRPSDPLPQQRIDEINQILNKQNDQEKLEAKYKELVDQGDNLFEKGEWKDAKDAFTQAFNIYNREYPERKIAECETNMKKATDDTVEKNYQKIIAKADEHFASKSYEKAKKMYNRALSIKPGDQYPKNQLKEIENLLNPGALSQNKANLTNWGDPNRSANAIDVDAMLADAEAQREFKRTQQAEQQELDAAEAETEFDSTQVESTFVARKESESIRTDLEEADEVAQEKRVEANEEVDDMEVTLSDTDRERTVMNENDVQRQNQVVENINVELSERDDAADLPREEYLADVEEIRTELVVESTIEDNDQTNATFDQKEYVETYVENRAESDINKDVDRKNTEVYIEDYSVTLVNESNENSWDQEDEVMMVKEEVELDLDRRIANDLNDDIPRRETEGQIEDVNLERQGVFTVYQDEQYDVTIDQKKYTENMVTDIEIENMDNDQGRRKMEDFAEEQRIETSEVVDELQVDQTNETFETEDYVEEMELDQENNQQEDEEKREGYEKEVVAIQEEKDGFLDENDAEAENESYATVDYLEDRNKERRDEQKEADEKATDNIDDTKDAVEEIQDENAEWDEKNKDELEDAEDYVESLKDIKVDEIDEEAQNALGSQFPEGVTEEIFTINDEDGLIESYVVRRVVVRNGVGNVYEKVQTKFGTVSYTCNGNGITEYDWQDQTEAADLVRN
jgi:tetratricopeptide (TPR) repeat protein